MCRGYAFCRGNRTTPQHFGSPDAHRLLILILLLILIPSVPQKAIGRGAGAQRHQNAARQYEHPALHCSMCITIVIH